MGWVNFILTVPSAPATTLFLLAETVATCANNQCIKSDKDILQLVQGIAAIQLIDRRHGPSNAPDQVSG